MSCKFLLITVFVVAFQFFSSAAFAIVDTVYWRANAAFLNINEKATEFGDATILEDNRYIAFNTDSREITRHKIIHIKTQEGLDANNKITVHIPTGGTLKNVKARSVSAKGEIVEITQDDVKEMKDFQHGGKLKMFAIEGAELGGQIEYTYTVRTPLYDTGKETLSMDYRTLHACVLIRSVPQFQFDSKSSNWTSEDIRTSEEHRYIYKNVLPIAEEEYSTPRANRVAVEFKVLGSSYAKSPYSSYPKAVESLQKDFGQFESKDLRKVSGLLKNFNGQVAGNEKQTLRNLTAFLKRKLVYKDDYSSDYSDVAAVVKSGLGNDVGLTKVYCIFLDKLNINYQLYATCNKYDNRLNQDYCSRYSLDEFILYFPEHRSYLYPAGQLAHFGLAPSWIVGSTALVIPKYGNNVSFKEIEDNHPDSNRINLNIDVNIDLANSNTILNIEGYGMGHLARTYNRYVHYSETESELNEKLRGIVEWRYPDAQIMWIEMVDPQDWGNIGKCKNYACKKEYKAKVKSTTFYENLGNKLLLNVGSLLGPQTELYSELERVQPITTAYNKSYSFEITIPIPEKYKFSGADGLSIENELVDDQGNILASFKSEVVVEESSLKIKIYEFYSKVNVDKKYYNQYRIVINSAADFNKGTILLEKQ